jgi:hypothetical protein
LIAPATRAIRELFSGAAEATGRISEAARQKVEAHRQQAGRKLKMARLLSGGGLLEEEREALLQAMSWVGKALAIENQFAEPETLNDALRAPASVFWGELLPLMNEYAANPASPSAPICEALQGLIVRG